MGEVHVQIKRRLRQEMQAVRRSLPPEEAARRSVEACGRLVALPVFRAAARVVVYAPVDGELDAAAAARSALEAGKTVYYPRMNAAGLDFLCADAAALRPGRFGVPEPPDGTPLAGGEDGATLFIVPALAFDLRGVRLGRGAGHYDRALRDRPLAGRIGIAFEFQIVPRLPEDTWDVAMSTVVTDARLIGGSGPTS